MTQVMLETDDDRQLVFAAENKLEMTKMLAANIPMLAKDKRL